MPERELELRLRSAARALDAHAPAFDAALLGRPSRRRTVRAVVVFACIAALTAAPVAVPALRALFDVDEVPALGPLGPGVMQPYAGRTVPVASLEASVPFRVRAIPSLGVPHAARVRDDIQGGMVTLVYRNGVALTEWRTNDVHPRIALVPVAGTAEDVEVGAARGLWVEGAARGTFALVGADWATHHESFEVSRGALLWSDGDMTFLLQRAGSRAEASRLAAEIAR